MAEGHSGRPERRSGQGRSVGPVLSRQPATAALRKAQDRAGRRRAVADLAATLKPPPKRRRGRPSKAEQRAEEAARRRHLDQLWRQAEAEWLATRRPHG